MLYHPVKIGSLTLPGNLFLAPVAGYSDRAFRCVCVDGGADFTYTEMVSSEALTRGSSKTEILMRKAPNEKAYAVQLFGSNPATMALAARLVLEKTGADCIDINAGCPVPKIIKTGAGSALIRDPEKLFALVSAVVKAVDKKVPVTVKIRSGWDAEHITWKESAQAVIDAGASAVTLHARTRAQGYEGRSDWNILRSLAEFAGQKIPVFGSGDVFSPEDAKSMLETTGCSGVMFARGAMGHPFIFRQTRQLLEKNFYEEIGFDERIEAGFKELSLLISDKGENAACREMRKRFCAYSKGAAGGAELRRRIVSASREQDYKNIFAL
ncbi:tRNA dihydrouridine synthase DusB [Treponema parvum]|uniref:tRNA dihydrouridine synthase DusB n=1 Tax=Treponema parvum TaxID=138851 RepID=UPI001AEC1B67|nr:tRNA dihydrouridine synthase DusB [Treponema parvum]QTQ17137.1 tRNA dihydrouridine synthase DusB [Treponema parvum]